MILAARETLGGHTNSGLLPRAQAEMILAARETLGGHTNSGLLPRALAELILAALEPAPMSKGTGALGVTPHGSRHGSSSSPAAG